MRLIPSVSDSAVIHYGFGKNIWDIYPQDNITKAYKVRPLPRSIGKTDSCSISLPLCWRTKH